MFGIKYYDYYYIAEIILINYTEKSVETNLNKLIYNYVFRCLARLYLLHVHKLHVLESPPIQPLDRKTVGTKQNDQLNSVITLPSGRTIRKLDNGNFTFIMLSVIIS